MATNRTPLEALDYASRFEGNAPIDDADLKLRILQAASDMIHLAAAWRWSVDLTTSQNLANGDVDYTFSAPSPEALYIVRAQLRDANGGLRELKPSAVVSNDGNIKGKPDEIQLVSQTSVKVYPVPASSTTQRLIVHHKKQNTVITEANDDSAASLLLPDEWFFVYQEAVLLWTMRFMQNPAAGTVSFSGGQANYSGQHAYVMSLIEFMRLKEKPFLMDTMGVVNG